MQSVSGWAACTCKGGTGKCKVETKEILGGDKIEISCSAGTCKGTCELAAGTASEVRNVLTGAMLATT
jgi:hypothetical protein